MSCRKPWLRNTGLDNEAIKISPILRTPHSLPCPQNPANGSYSEQPDFSPHQHSIIILKKKSILITFHVRQNLPRKHCGWTFTGQILECISHFSHMYNMPNRTHLPWYNEPKNIRRTAGPQNWSGPRVTRRWTLLGDPHGAPPSILFCNTLTQCFQTFFKWRKS
jgi:hypothetical protein